ncbi:MAG TPA: hypothetical protein VGG75_14895 [Trebonia sp.]|jgi:hypothetical protein
MTGEGFNAAQARRYERMRQSAARQADPAREAEWEQLRDHHLAREENHQRSQRARAEAQVEIGQLAELYRGQAAADLELTHGDGAEAGADGPEIEP